MKVLILTEGSRNTGFGHLSRSIALYQAIRGRGHEPELIINSDSSVSDFIRGVKWQRLDWISHQGRLIKLIERVQFVVIDSYLAEKTLYDKISAITNGNLLMIDDCKRLSYPGGIVANPSIHGDGLRYPKKDGVAYLLGRDYIVLRKEFLDAPKKNIKKNIKNILVTFGGIHKPLLVKKIIDALGKYNYSFFVIDAHKKKYTARGMLNLMLKADVCISGGGQTTYELARVGVPSIGICFAKNQIMNLRGWKKNRFMRYTLRHDDKNIGRKIFNMLNNMKSYSKRKSLSEAGRRCVDGAGAEHLVRAIEERVLSQGGILRFRNAASDDCHDVWQWRNNKDVRAACYNSSPIGYGEHRKWFHERIDRPGFFIAEDGNMHKVAQVRFDKNGKNSAFINVNLNPEYFGKGLGSKVIKKATERFMAERPDIKNIKAEILRGNTASLKAFKKSGYKLNNRLILKGKETFVFKFGRP